MTDEDDFSVSTATPRWYLPLAILSLMIGLAGLGLCVWAEWTKSMPSHVDAHWYLAGMVLPGAMSLLIMLPTEKDDSPGPGPLAGPILVLVALAFLWCIGFAAVEWSVPEEIGAPRVSKREGGMYPHPSSVRWDDLHAATQIGVGVLCVFPGLVVAGGVALAAWHLHRLVWGFRAASRELLQDLEALEAKGPSPLAKEARDLRQRLRGETTMTILPVVFSAGILLSIAGWTIQGVCAINVTKPSSPLIATVLLGVGFGACALCAAALWIFRKIREAA